MLAIVGNIIFMLWITYNGMKERFNGTLPEKVSYITLMGLLTINTILLLNGRKSKDNKNILK